MNSAVVEAMLAYLVYDYHHKARRSKWPLGVHSRVASEGLPSPLPVVASSSLFGRTYTARIERGAALTALHCGMPPQPEAVACKKKVAEAEKNSFFIALLPFCVEPRQKQPASARARMETKVITFVSVSQ